MPAVKHVPPSAQGRPLKIRSRTNHPYQRHRSKVQVTFGQLSPSFCIDGAATIYNMRICNLRGAFHMYIHRVKLLYSGQGVPQCKFSRADVIGQYAASPGWCCTSLSVKWLKVIDRCSCLVDLLWFRSFPYFRCFQVTDNINMCQVKFVSLK